MRIARINGFTLMELTVAMLITGIVVGISYSAFVIVMKSYHDFEARNQRAAAIIDFDHALKRDFDKADTVLKDSAGVELRMPGKIVKYSFYPGFVLRESNKTDTFKLRTTNVATCFEQAPLTGLQADTEMNRIDRLDLTVIGEADSLPCHYVKYYSSADLIKRNPHALH